MCCSKYLASMNVITQSNLNDIAIREFTCSLLNIILNNNNNYKIWCCPHIIKVILRQFYFFRLSLSRVCQHVLRAFQITTFSYQITLIFFSIQFI